MKSVRIAQFNISENGTIFGERGDQLKVPGSYETADTFAGELEIRPYSGSWDVVFRPIDRSAASLLARNAEATVRNPMVGYSQNPAGKPTERMSFYQALKSAGWDPAKIKTPVNADCSSGMAAWLCSVGIWVDPNMTTATERHILEQTDEFLILTDHIFTESSDYLMPGDVLLRQGHTALAIDYGRFVRSTIPGTMYRDMWHRADPDTTGRQLGIARSGDVVDAYMPMMHGRWYQIVLNGDIGWTAATGWDWMYLAKVTGWQVNIRELPSINSAVLATVGYGQRLPATGITSDDSRGITWHQVASGDVIGWISGVYAEIDGYI